MVVEAGEGERGVPHQQHLDNSSFWFLSSVLTNAEPN